MAPVKCKSCFGEFIPKRTGNIYCSPKCCNKEWAKKYRPSIRRIKKSKGLKP